MQGRIRDYLKERQLDAFLVADGFQMRYLSGFTGATGYLYMTKSRRVILTDSRYTLQAMEEGAGCEVMEISREEGYPEKLKKLVEEDRVQVWGFEDEAMLYADVERLKKALPVEKWEPAGGSLSFLRRIKTPEEIARMTKAQEITDRAFAYILGELKPGVTELEIAAKLEFWMKTHGAEDIAFASVIASGIHSSMPHATPSRKKLEPGDFITMDFGARYEGYCSDMTRTVVLGKASEKQKEIYRIVLEAQIAGLAAVRAGIPGAEADRAARSVIERAGYGECFGHALGHSVGLEVHERPSLSPKDTTVLRAGMIETVEPGIYVPGFGGVRIEDMVVVTEEGCQDLTRSPKELIEL